MGRASALDLFGSHPRRGPTRLRTRRRSPVNAGRLGGSSRWRYYEVVRAPHDLCHGCRTQNPPLGDNRARYLTRKGVRTSRCVARIQPGWRSRLTACSDVTEPNSSKQNESTTPANRRARTCPTGPLSWTNTGQLHSNVVQLFHPCYCLEHHSNQEGQAP